MVVTAIIMIIAVVALILARPGTRMLAIGSSVEVMSLMEVSIGIGSTLIIKSSGFMPSAGVIAPAVKIGISDVSTRDR